MLKVKKLLEKILQATEIRETLYSTSTAVMGGNVTLSKRADRFDRLEITAVNNDSRKLVQTMPNTGYTPFMFGNFGNDGTLYFKGALIGTSGDTTLSLSHAKRQGYILPNGTAGNVEAASAHVGILKVVGIRGGTA